MSGNHNSGRKPYAAALKRPRSIRFTDEEWARLTAWAAGMGKPLSELSREILLAAAEG